MKKIIFAALFAAAAVSGASAQQLSGDISPLKGQDIGKLVSKNLK